MTEPAGPTPDSASAPRPTIGRAIPLLGCGAILGILAVLIVKTGGRAIGVLIALAVALLVVLAVVRIRHRLMAVKQFRQAYGTAGKDLLIVYTASPHWEEYIEREWLPRWGERAVVLNRSKPWKPNSAEANLWFAHRTGREHTPLAVVIPLRGRVKVVRFFKAFRDHKHGKGAALQAKERELEAALEAASRGR